MTITKEQMRSIIVKELKGKGVIVELITTDGIYFKLKREKDGTFTVLDVIEY